MWLQVVTWWLRVVTWWLHVATCGYMWFHLEGRGHDREEVPMLLGEAQVVRPMEVLAQLGAHLPWQLVETHELHAWR